MKSSNAFLSFIAGLLLGTLAAYALQMRKVVELQETLLAKNIPPQPLIRADWWENNQPDTEDEYELIKAQHHWLQQFLLKYIHPYVDRNAYTVLIQEFIMPLNHRLSELEIEQLHAERQAELRRKTKKPSNHLDA